MEEIKEDEGMQKVREAHLKRAADIVKSCHFTEPKLTEGASHASRTIELIFEEMTRELALLLPRDFRTALCLENLESACLWAKKAIYVHDIATAIREEKTNGPSNDNN